VLGPPRVVPTSVEKINETSEVIYQILAGKPIPPNYGNPVTGFVDVRDVARVFVWAVEHPEIANGERYITAAGVFTNQAIADLLRKHYPHLKIEVGTPGEGYPPDFKPIPEGITIDASKSIKATGQDYIGFEKMILDAAKEFEKLL
jgi:nucleoside-diphosphate-sugar epimerase